eukprot:5656139-Pyramimonas_sp.AAC.1
MLFWLRPTWMTATTLQVKTFLAGYSRPSATWRRVAAMLEAARACELRATPAESPGSLALRGAAPL